MQPRMVDIVVRQTMLNTTHVLLAHGVLILRLALKYQNAKLDVQMMLIVKAILSRRLTQKRRQLQQAMIYVIFILLLMPQNFALLTILIIPICHKLPLNK